MNPKVRWEEMFPDELDAALARRPLVYLTYGLLLTPQEAEREFSANVAAPVRAENWDE